MSRAAPVVACLLCLTAPLPAMAAAAEEATDDGLEPGASAPDYPLVSGNIGLGLFRASGSTDSSSTNLDVEAKLEYDRWRHDFAVTAYLASEEGEETAERYSGRVQSNRDITERTYLFAAARHEVDRFGAFDRRASLTTGLGRRFLDRETLLLDLEAGLGRRVSEPDGTNDREGATIGLVRGDFAWQFADTSELTQELEVLSGSDNTATRSVSGVKSELTGDLALKVTYTVEHNSDVSADAENTDTFTAITLEYGF